VTIGTFFVLSQVTRRRVVAAVMSLFLSFYIIKRSLSRGDPQLIIIFVMNIMKGTINKFPP
jgi:hypothetical protein